MEKRNIHEELIVELQQRKQHRILIGISTVLMCGIGMLFLVLK